MDMLELYLEVKEVRKTPHGVQISMGRPPNVQEVPMPESEEEAMMYQMIRAMEKYVKLPVMAVTMESPIVATVTLTDDEYQSLGKPTVGDVIRITLSKGEG